MPKNKWKNWEEKAKVRKLMPMPVPLFFKNCGLLIKPIKGKIYFGPRSKLRRHGCWRILDWLLSEDKLNYAKEEPNKKKAVNEAKSGI